MKAKILPKLALGVLLLISFRGYTQSVNTQDSLVLVNLYDSTDGANWINHSGWLTTAPLSTWYGITIDAFGNVGEIKLAANGLKDSIPKTLGNLSLLDTLNLNDNQLSGSIPPQMGNLYWLRVLNLDGNQLSGSIPKELDKLSRLQNLILSHNHLTGSIPVGLGNLFQVNILALNGNQLSDTIPASIGHLFNVGSLGFLYLDSNKFTFSSLEAIGSIHFGTTDYAPQDTILPLHFDLNTNLLSASAGGTLNNNTYKWYRDGTLVSTKTGDSTLPVTDIGNYTVAVSNTKATALTLYSDTILITTLPVKLVSFSGSFIKNDVLLNWQTAAEKNADHYSVERSTNGVLFIIAGAVKAKDNSSIAELYNFTDLNAGQINTAVLYYRLKIVDKDGRYTYSGVIKINFNNTGVRPFAYPNPVNNNATVVFNATIASKYVINVTDITGKTIKRIEGVSVNGTSNVTVDMNGFAKGTYIITLISNGSRQSLKVVKE